MPYFEIYPECAVSHTLKSVPIGHSSGPLEQSSGTWAPTQKGCPCPLG